MVPGPGYPGAAPGQGRLRDSSGAHVESVWLEESRTEYVDVEIGGQTGMQRARTEWLLWYQALDTRVLPQAPLAWGPEGEADQPLTWGDQPLTWGT